MRYTAIFLAGLIVSQPSFSNHSTVEEVIVEGGLSENQILVLDNTTQLVASDSAALLRTLPGANVNSNGPITGIVQYRGMYGSRVNVHIDQSPALTGGPNSMDTPLSYTPPLLLKTLKLKRGIAPVREGQETLGGHLSVELDRGSFSGTDDAMIHGAVTSRFNDNNDGFSHAIKAHVANQHHKAALLASHDEADDIHIGDDDILGGTQHRRSRYDLSYGWKHDESQIEIFGGKLDTRRTGTPALPMDIDYIDSDIAGLNGLTTIGSATVNAQLGYSHVDHLMDNFSQRLAPASAMMFRANRATARQHNWRFETQLPTAGGTFSLGVDGNSSVHNSKISNPNNPAFSVHNFNNTTRDIYGVFAQWQGNVADWSLSSGVRYNRVESDADRVSVNGMTGMMATNVATLVDRFNNAERNKIDHNVDLVVEAATDLSRSLQLQLAAAIKNRAPSYQERYLWLPLTATGGLADGRNYIGNLALDSETAQEVTAGLHWQTANGWFSPQLFYRKIEDYIQGVVSTDTVANTVSTMMSGLPALEFQNIDARISGIDIGYGRRLSHHLSLEGNLSYVRGKDTENNDNLYRIAPLNNRLALTWQGETISLTAESILYAKQTKVARYNSEQKSAGYGIFNLRTDYKIADNLTFAAGAENLFDKRYQDHLAGYNRNGDSDVPVGERLFGAGRSLWLAATLDW